MRPIVAEKNDTTGQMLRFYVWSPSGALLYMIDAANGNSVRHFHFDRVGSTLALTDSAGAVTDSYAYTPYGEPLGRTGTSQQPFLYIGRYGVRSEPVARLYHMRARYYDPVTARFLTRDPVWPLLGQPMTLQPYQYSINNPLKYIDPSGREVEIDGSMIVGAFLFRPDQIDASRKGGLGSLSLSPPVPEPEPLEDILTDIGPEGAYAAMMAAMTSQGDDYVPARFRSPAVVTTASSKAREMINPSLARALRRMPIGGGMTQLDPPTLDLSASKTEPQLVPGGAGLLYSQSEMHGVGVTSLGLTEQQRNEFLAFAAWFYMYFSALESYHELTKDVKTETTKSIYSVPMNFRF